MTTINKILVTGLTLFALVGSVSGAHLYLEQRYATTDSVEQESQKTRAQVLRGQIWQLEDQILHLEARDDLTSSERARLSLYIRRLKDLRNQLREIE